MKINNRTLGRIFILLLLILLGNFLARIFLYRNEYLIRYDAKYWKERYEKSQWATALTCYLTDPHINPETCVWDDAWYQSNKNKPFNNDPRKSIGDDGLYAYAGWEYIKGHDPTTLNAEAPPLGKYLIGASILLFRNQNIFALLCGIFALASFYFFNLTLFKDKLLAIFPVVLFSFEPLFYTQLKAPYLDLLYLGLLFMSFAFMLKKKYIWTGVFIGLMAATKSSASTFLIVYGAISAYLLLSRQFKEFKKLLLSVPVSLMVFASVYLRYFLLGHDLRGFLGVQKWVINFYNSGAKGSFAAPYELLLTGSWKSWWGETVKVAEWNFGWLISFMLTVYYLVEGLRRRRIGKLMFTGIWIIVYLLFLSFVPLWPRYLLLLLPFMYNLSVWVLLTKSQRSR